MNGINDSEWEDKDRIRKIELVMEHLSVMLPIRHFKGIKVLILTNCLLKKIEVMY